MRSEFIRELTEASKVLEDTFLVVGDLGYGVVEPFQETFPQRFLNSGVAEQSMMSISAGIASQGASVFAYSIANFPTFRALEQIRNDVVAHNLPVTVVAVGAGLGYGTLGYTHHAIEDFAIMRAMAGLEIYSPADSFELEAAMKLILSCRKPAYLRLGKGGETPLHDGPIENSNKVLRLSGPEDAEWVVVSTGSIGANAARAISSMAPELRDRTLHYSVPVFSAVQSLARSLKNARGIVSVEEHRPSGGLGSLILETLSEDGLGIPIRRLGVKSGKARIVGNQDYLLSQHGLDDASLQEEFEAFFSQISADKSTSSTAMKVETGIHLRQP